MASTSDLEPPPTPQLRGCLPWLAGHAIVDSSLALPCATTLWLLCGAGDASGYARASPVIVYNPPWSALTPFPPVCGPSFLQIAPDSFHLDEFCHVAPSYTRLRLHLAGLLTAWSITTSGDPSRSISYRLQLPLPATYTHPPISLVEQQACPIFVFGWVVVVVACIITR
ncbi:hypothetical protein Cob_v006465 [Colletotrichum orbiculare MAFF 240422]|uniref:Uncharacterized protein n=1 Tax=Colletotrichum orbiculare (strain 104-T / ATCC 96160 / CBS 514.97 / LARS 414 / MAFF 240422) TaxID=1213857 RepID=A0A484FRF1_COLOR|nr:hypothetical protein Cob_v006465 [Colletotrichum orbiculare MAFF 240422]